MTKDTDPERIKWLWKRVSEQDYAFDDPGREYGAEVWLRQIFDPATECYEYGDIGYLVLGSIVPPVSAIIHFCTWGDYEFADIIPAKKEILNHAFGDLGLNRITAMIPSPNKGAIRLATLSGFRYEGELRQAFLKNKVYYNIHIYGLLKEEFYRREVRH